MSEKLTIRVFVAFTAVIAVLAINLLPAGIPLVRADEAQQASGTAASSTETPTGGVGSILREVGGQTKLPSYDAGHAKQNYQSGASQLTSIVYFVLDFFKYIFGGIADHGFDMGAFAEGQ